jgi:hypothetical protein
VVADGFSHRFQPDQVAASAADGVTSASNKIYSKPWFLENGKRWADALHSAGADVVTTERIGDHGDPFWQAEFPLMVKWAMKP